MCHSRAFTTFITADRTQILFHPPLFLPLTDTDRVLVNMLHVLREKSANAKLDRAAFSAIMEKIGITDPVVIASYFKNWDTNHDEQLDFAEIVSALAVIEHGSHHEKLNAIFAVYDLDGNKRLTRDELTRALRAMAHVRRTQLQLAHALTAQDVADIDAQVAEIFEHTDKDGNGVITLRELSQFSASDLSFNQCLVTALGREFGTSIKLKKAHSLLLL
jgi:Ca2+-binding EF-hand superfamily protein